MSLITTKATDDFIVLDEEGNKISTPLPDDYKISGESIYKYGGNQYSSSVIEYYPRGRIVYYGSLT